MNELKKGLYNRDFDRVSAAIADTRSRLTGSLSAANVAGKNGAGVSARIIASIKLLTDVLKQQETLSKSLRDQISTMDKNLGKLKSAVLSEGVKLNLEGIKENYARYKDYVANVEQAEQELINEIKRIRETFAGKISFTQSEIAELNASINEIRNQKSVIDGHENLVKSSNIKQVFDVMAAYGGLPQEINMDVMFENMKQKRDVFLAQIDKVQAEIQKKEQNIPQISKDLDGAIESINSDIATKKIQLRQNLDTGALSQNLTLRKVNKKEMDIVLQNCTNMWSLIATLIQQQNEIEFRLVQMNSFDQELKTQISTAKKESINLITETLTHGQQRMM